jgi:quercetin dioxygenase-like cupin family protein
MNLSDQHAAQEVSVYPLLEMKEGRVVALRIQRGSQLKPHISNRPAILLCVNGHARYSNELNEDHELRSGDLVHIEPMVKHWVKGLETTDFILLK